MKYLKPFFESVVRGEVNYLLANLTDVGFVVTTSYLGSTAGEVIYVRKPEILGCVKVFNVDEVESEILRMCEFLSDRYEYNISYIYANKDRQKMMNLQLQKRQASSVRISIYKKTFNDQELI